MIEIPTYTHSGIYAIYNETRNMWYIGSSWNIRQRAKGKALKRAVEARIAIEAQKKGEE